MEIARAVAVVVFITTAGCVAATAPPAVPSDRPMASSRGGPIDDELRAAPGDRESLLWSATRPLVLTDFRAPVPAEAVVEGARTAYLVSYGMWCRNGVFHFAASTSFLPDHSWVRPHAFSDPPEGRRILNHEQTHFNQAEIYTRRMRKFFREQLYYPCGQTEAQLNAMADRFITDETEAQRRYDDETSFGRIPERQRAWDRMVADTLASLEAYAASSEPPAAP